MREREREGGVYYVCACGVYLFLFMYLFIYLQILHFCINMSLPVTGHARHLIHNLLHAFSNKHRLWPNRQLHSLQGPVLTKGLCVARNLNTEVIQPRNVTADNNVAGGRKLVKQTTLFSNLVSRRGDRVDHSFPTAVPVLPAG